MTKPTHSYKHWTDKGGQVNQNSGDFQLKRNGLRDLARIDRPLFVIVIANLACSFQGCALSLAGLRRQTGLHWKRWMSLLRTGLAALQFEVLGYPKKVDRSLGLTK